MLEVRVPLSKWHLVIDLNWRYLPCSVLDSRTMSRRRDAGAIATVIAGRKDGYLGSRTSIYRLSQQVDSETPHSINIHNQQPWSWSLLWSTLKWTFPITLSWCLVVIILLSIVRGCLETSGCSWERLLNRRAKACPILRNSRLILCSTHLFDYFAIYYQCITVCLYAEMLCFHNLRSWCSRTRIPTTDRPASAFYF